MRYRTTAALLATVLAASLAPGSAQADPKGDAFPVTCDDGGTYFLTGNGNGNFTPAHHVDSTAVFVPVSFGVFTGTVRDTNGNVVQTFTEPATSKGQSAKGLKDPVTCTFEFTFVNDGSDTDFPAGFSFTGSGSAVVRVTPSR